jgi:hypothetical protein
MKKISHLIQMHNDIFHQMCMYTLCQRDIESIRPYFKGTLLYQLVLYYILRVNILQTAKVNGFQGMWLESL